MSEIEKRSADRQALSMAANFLSLERDRSVALVSDLTIQGCKIDRASSRLDSGNRVIIRPEGFEGFHGTVKWVSDSFAGVEFDQPLHPAIVDHLCRLHPGHPTEVRLDVTPFDVDGDTHRDANDGSAPDVPSGR